MPFATHAVDVFLLMHDAVRRGVPMVPRSSSDKEYFAQDWFLERIKELGCDWEQPGRNSYPDFWLIRGGIREGYEIKSLANPPRADFDANSTIPSGVRSGLNVFIAFFIYTGSTSELRYVHSIALMHGDLVNDERDITHENFPVRGFGSFGDAFIRDRKMYVLKHAFTIEPSCLGRIRLIAPAEWGLEHDRLRRVMQKERSVAAERLRSYTVDLYDARVTPVMEPNPRAGEVRRFDIFEHV